MRFLEYDGVDFAAHYRRIIWGGDPGNLRGVELPRRRSRVGLRARNLSHSPRKPHDDCADFLFLFVVFSNHRGRWFRDSSIRASPWMFTEVLSRLLS